MTDAYTLFFAEEAEKDLYELYTYIAQNDSERAAEQTLGKIETHCQTLETLPQRGRHPRELKRLGLTTYLELTMKPYRILYQIVDMNVYIHAILDGRRDLEDHLLRRLF